MENPSSNTYLVFDIGGTWIKATRIIDDTFSETFKAPSGLKPGSSPDDLVTTLLDLAQKTQTTSPAAIAIATAGVVNDHGTAVGHCSPHLAALRDPCWIAQIESHFDCPVTLINDADAALIGAAEKGYLQGSQTIGLLVIGTGLGFSVWRNGRRWRPGWSYILLGITSIGSTSFDDSVSASLLAALSPKNDLVEVLTSDEFTEARNDYFFRLAAAVQTAATLYSLDEVALSGGLIDACTTASFDLEKEIRRHLGPSAPSLRVLHEGNALQQIGAHALAKAEAIAESARFTGDHRQLPTEQAHDPDLQLESLSAHELVTTFLQAEQEAGSALTESTAAIASAAEKIAAKLRAGGRLIYVGCGTSGRLASLDALELPCTYGLDPDRALCLIAGGIADAAIDIEHRSEEDASASPELLLLKLAENDVLIGISASASAHYVRSALAVAKSKNALTYLISAEDPREDFYHHHLALHSGPEVVSGSTRMKAGTATKKILNTLSSTAMILLGKVRGTHMIDLACLNDKLIHRATGILEDHFALSSARALQLLKKHHYQLLDAIADLEKRR